MRMSGLQRKIESNLLLLKSTIFREFKWIHLFRHADYPVKLFMRVFQQFACDFKLMTKMGEFAVRDSRGYRCTSQLDTWYPYCVQAVCRKADAVGGLSIKFSPTFDLSREGRLVIEASILCAIIVLVNGSLGLGA